MHFPHAELLEVPVENGLVGATNTASTPGQSVLEKGLDGLNQAIPTKGSG